MTADFKKSNLLSPHEEASLASGWILQNLEVASPPLFPLLGVLDVPEKGQNIREVTFKTLTESERTNK